MPAEVVSYVHCTRAPCTLNKLAQFMACLERTDLDSNLLLPWDRRRKPAPTTFSYYFNTIHDILSEQYAILTT